MEGMKNGGDGGDRGDGEDVEDGEWMGWKGLRGSRGWRGSTSGQRRQQQSSWHRVPSQGFPCIAVQAWGKPSAKCLGGEFAKLDLPPFPKKEKKMVKC